MPAYNYGAGSVPPERPFESTHGTSSSAAPEGPVPGPAGQTSGLTAEELVELERDILTAMEGEVSDKETSEDDVEKKAAVKEEVVVAPPAPSPSTASSPLAAENTARQQNRGPPPYIKKLHAAQQELLDRQHTKIKKMEEDNEKLRREVASLETKNKTLEDNYQYETHEFELKDNECINLQKKLEQQLADHQQTREQLAAYRAELSSTQVTEREATGRVQELEDANADLNDKLRQSQEENEHAVERRDIWQMQWEDVQKTNSAMEAALAENSKTIQELMDQGEKYNADLLAFKHCQAELYDTQASLQSARIQIENMKTDKSSPFPLHHARTFQSLPESEEDKTPLSTSGLGNLADELESNLNVVGSVKSSKRLAVAANISDEELGDDTDDEKTASIKSLASEVDPNENMSVIDSLHDKEQQPVHIVLPAERQVHHPISCWFLVEYNMAILLNSWLQDAWATVAPVFRSTLGLKQLSKVSHDNYVELGDAGKDSTGPERGNSDRRSDGTYNKDLGPHGLEKPKKQIITDEATLRQKMRESFTPLEETFGAEKIPSGSGQLTMAGREETAASGSINKSIPQPGAMAMMNTAFSMKSTEAAPYGTARAHRKAGTSTCESSKTDIVLRDYWAQTTICFAIHIVFYFFLYFLYLNYVERHLWLAANEQTRFFVRSLLHNRSFTDRYGRGVSVRLLPEEWVAVTDSLVHSVLRAVGLRMKAFSIPG